MEQKLEKKLLGLKKDLETQLKSFTRENPQIKGDYETKFAQIGADIDDEALETEQYLSQLPVEHSLEKRLKLVNSALERLQKGKYGVCQNCGRQIKSARLQAAPETAYCLKCEKKTER